MDLSRWLEQVKIALRMAGLNHAAEAAPELLANIGGAESNVSDSSSTKSGFSLSKIERTGGTGPLSLFDCGRLL